MTIKVVGNTNLADVSITHLGTVEALFALCAANGLMPDDDLAVGQALVLPSVFDQDIVSYLVGRGHVVATEATMLSLGTGGVSYSDGFNEGFA